MTMEYVEGYELLANILTDAFEQSAKGKGRERHGLGDAWHDQPIITLGREFGVGGTNFQAAKKMREAQKMAERGEFDAAERELLGTIVYAAASIALVREMKAKKAAIPAPVKEPEAIPAGVYWDEASIEFRNDWGSFQGRPFKQEWFKRRHEFPAYSPNPLPIGVFWDEENDVFRNGQGTVLMGYGSWLNRKNEFPSYAARFRSN